MKQAKIIKRVKITLLLGLALALSVISAHRKIAVNAAPPTLAVGHATEQTPAPQRQKKINPQSAGCINCHTGTESMHADGDESVGVGCADCHGGNPQEAQDKKKAHVQPRNPEWFKSTANPERLNALWLKESAEFVRFINPGDFRAADLSCGKVSRARGRLE